VVRVDQVLRFPTILNKFEIFKLYEFRSFHVSNDMKNATY
jgi:hypothetical protein